LSLLSSFVLVVAVFRKLLEKPLHHVDLGDVGCNEMIPASLAGGHLKMATSVSGGRTSATEMDKGGEILLLLRIDGHGARSSDDGGDIAVQIYGCKLGGMARKRADVGT
jgi:hypothetical protein